MTTPQQAREDRWADCDVLPDRLDRIECRTSKLNDGFHDLAAAVELLTAEQRVTAGKLAPLGITKWAAILGVAVTAIKIVFDAVLQFIH